MRVKDPKEPGYIIDGSKDSQIEEKKWGHISRTWGGRRALGA